MTVYIEVQEDIVVELPAIECSLHLGSCSQDVPSQLVIS